MATALLGEKELTLIDGDGEGRTYFISKIPAIPAREIVTQYPISAMPKLGDYAVNEQLMLKLLSFVEVAVDAGGGQTKRLRLTTKELINNHVPDWELLAKLEMAMLEYNISFFRKGTASIFSAAFEQKVPQLITKILTALREQSSAPTKPASTNSEQSTP